MVKISIVLACQLGVDRQPFAEVSGIKLEDRSRYAYLSQKHQKLRAHSKGKRRMTPEMLALLEHLGLGASFMYVSWLLFQRLNVLTDRLIDILAKQDQINAALVERSEQRDQ